MKVSLELSQPTNIPIVCMVMLGICVLVLIWAGGSLQEEPATGKSPARSMRILANTAGVGVFVFVSLLIGTVFLYEHDKLGPLEAAYEEQHGVTDMDAQVNRSSELGSLLCLPNNGEGSVAYKWTDADGTRKSGLLEKEFPYQGECEYTLKAVE